MPCTAEFGILGQPDADRSYDQWEPERYHCVAIDDDYLDDWWPRLTQMRTFYHSLSRPGTALARWGVTLIPPESLPVFLSAVTADARFHADPALAALAGTIQAAICQHAFLIHFGV